MRARLALGLLTLLAACAPREPAAPPEPAPPGRIAVDPRAGTTRVTLLYTSDEHGWVEAHAEKGRVRGGAPEALAQWVALEGHCPGPSPDGAESTPRPAACADPSTILLSGGDDFTGPAISTHFAGEPMARAMRRMGYVAAAFGNHELDFGRDGFVKDRGLAGATWLAANVRATDPRKDLGMPAFTLVQRRGATIAVVGLATESTLKVAMASRFEGLAIDPAEPALDRAIAAAWGEGPDAVVLVAHECPEVLAPIVERHPEWKLAFVGGGHCHTLESRRAGGVPVVSPGWRLDHYARVVLDVDRKRPMGDRVTSADVALVEVAHPEGTQVASDAPLAKEIGAWRARVDQELGQPIGTAPAALARTDPALGRFLAAPWREKVGADVAIINSGGIRQSLPAGPISRATILSILPFENAIMTVSVTAAELAAELANPESIAVGARLGPNGAVLDDAGKPIPPEKRLTVAITDFAYRGGSGYRWQKLDPKGKETGINWREPIEAWLVARRGHP
jgi:2',3'-cyclic-nucleotide 2'-phosphodiesterase (5'-nucleotidase family)